MINRFSFFILSFFVLLPFSLNAQKKITLEDAVASPTFKPKAIQEIRSMNDGEYYTTLEHNAYVVRFKYTTGLPVDTLLSLAWFKSDSIPYIADYEFNPDETKILVSTNVNQMYRHSFSANFYVYDIKRRSIQPVSTNGKQQLATFSPTSDKVAFLRQNNIYIVEQASKKETQITFDGKRNEIINGAPDWHSRQA